MPLLKCPATFHTTRFFTVPVLSIEQSVYRVDEEDGNVSIRVSVVGERTTVVNFSIVTSNESATGKCCIFLLPS